MLIFTAAVGGGHAAAAQAVRDALEAVGHEATIVDGLATMSHRLNWVSVDFYAWQLARAPWSYGMAFWALGLRPVAVLVRFLVGVLWGDRLLRILIAERPDAVVSTYPTVTAGLGLLRRTGRLGAPVTAVVTDFGAHPMWVSPHIDLHLVPARLSGELVERAGGRAEVMRFPVRDGFRIDMSRGDARAALGLPADAFVPLITGGAWGIGAVEEATAQALAAGAVPVVVAGRNEALRARLERRFADQPNVRIIGWTNDIPLLMAAADCLVQHAGGVTCLEALAVGLPIVFYRAIPGHGVLNAHLMEKVGAARRIEGPAALDDLFRRAAEGTVVLTAPARELGRDVVEAILMGHRNPDHAQAQPGRPSIASLAAVQLTIGLVATIGIVAFAKVTKADGRAIAHGGVALSYPLLALWISIVIGLALASFGIAAAGSPADRRRILDEPPGHLPWTLFGFVAIGVIATMEWRFPFI